MHRLLCERFLNSSSENLRQQRRLRIIESSRKDKLLLSSWFSAESVDAEISDISKRGQIKPKLPSWLDATGVKWESTFQWTRLKVYFCRLWLVTRLWTFVLRFVSPCEILASVQQILAWETFSHWPPPVKPMLCFGSRATRVAVHQSYYDHFFSLPWLLGSQLHSGGLAKFTLIYAILLPLDYDWWFLVGGDYFYTFISSHLLLKPGLNKWLRPWHSL